MTGREDAGCVERAFCESFSSVLHNDSRSEAYNNLALGRSEDTRVSDVQILEGGEYLMMGMPPSRARRRISGLYRTRR